MSEAAKKQGATRSELSPEGTAEEAALLALLDHLGRLLAREYVDRLERPTYEPAPGKRR